MKLEEKKVKCNWNHRGREVVTHKTLTIMGSCLILFRDEKPFMLEMGDTCK